MTREELEKKLRAAGRRKRLTGERLEAFVRVPMEAMFPVPRKARAKRPALLRAQANPRRRKNPVTPHHSQRQLNVIKAIQLFQRFRAQDPKFVDEIDVTFHREMLAVGKVVAVEYDTVRSGKNERYRHEFTGKSRPTLAASFDGAQLYFVGGAYDFTDRGIVDRKK